MTIITRPVNSIVTKKENISYAINELSKEFNVTSRALRLYEESGLLAPVREGTKRIYSERDRVRLRLILRGKRLGWLLSEIKEIFDLYDSRSGEKAQLDFFLDKLEERRKILQLQKQDVDLALEELERIAINARAALDSLNGESGQSTEEQR